MSGPNTLGRSILMPLFILQVCAFKAKGLSAACICGDDDTAKKDDVIAGKFQLVFFTPEALLMNRRWRKLLLSDNYQRRIKGLVLDEAHTVQKWLVILWKLYMEYMSGSLM